MAELNFNTALKYPFNRAKGLLNILWILVPIYGWFLLGGYSVRILNEFMQGKYQQLPQSNGTEDFKLGFFMFLKSIPFFLAYAIITRIFSRISPSLEILNFLIDVFIVPMLMLNFYKKQTIESFFEFNIINKVFNNLGEYIIISLKSIGLFLIFLVMSIVLIGVPALVFGGYIFYGQFYQKYILSKSKVKEE